MRWQKYISQHEKNNMHTKRIVEYARQKLLPPLLHPLTFLMVRPQRLYSKYSLTLKEWRFNLSFSCVSVLFLNSWRVSGHIVRCETNPPAIQKQH
jgi:hypothetical protein